MCTGRVPWPKYSLYKNMNAIPFIRNTAERGMYHLLGGKSMLLKISSKTAVKSYPSINHLFENKISIEYTEP